LLRKLFFSIILISSVASLSYSQAISDLTVSADAISYSDDGTTLEASGSVDAVSGTTLIKTNDFTYNINTKDITAHKGFKMTMLGGLTLEGDSLDYNVQSKNGLTKNVKIELRSSVITGKAASIDEEKIELKDASFTTCDLPDPHYHMTSMTTTVYPDDGWVIGYFGFLWLGHYPILPVPVYMYDLSSLSGSGQSKAVRDVLSMPEVGSNDIDGSYILYTVPWIANRKLNGKVHLMYTEKGGLAEGVDGNYATSDWNEVNARVYYDPRYSYYGGITDTYDFGPSIGQKKQLLYNFLKVQDSLLCELETDMSYKERINYERVSMLPNVTLRFNEAPAFVGNFKVGGEISYGNVSEESSGASFDRGILKTNGTFTFPTDIGRLSLGVRYNQSWYGFDQNWTRLANTTELDRDFGGGVNGYVSHLHYVYYTGNSPFNYEKYFLLPSDEFGFGLGYNFLSSRLTLDVSYYVPDWDPQDIDYGVTINMHCLSLDLKYRAMRQEFVFGVGLVAY
jgi:hypothetical protein